MEILVAVASKAEVVVDVVVGVAGEAVGVAGEAVGAAIAATRGASRSCIGSANSTRKAKTAAMAIIASSSTASGWRIRSRRQKNQ